MQNCLPEIKQAALVSEHFPSRMQEFIFRNWEMVDKERLALVLGTSTEKVEQEAIRMGLGEQGDTKVWAEKGYITIIRANWHLLPYEQLIQLLGWSEEKLAHILKEEDFLDIKLGTFTPFKPKSDKISYCELTEEQKQKTEKIKAAMQELAAHTPNDAKAPFDFWNKEKAAISKKQPKAGQVVLDNSWHISDKTGSETVAVMTERFLASMKKMWGVELAKDDGESKSIDLTFIPNQKDEYHEINIQQDKIVIKAGGAAGIMRGLYRLEDLSALSGGAFFDEAHYVREPRFNARFIYSFCGLYESAFDVDSRTYCPDSLLEEYARAGVNGIWMQGVLYRLIEFEYAPEMSAGWEKRQKNLVELAKRASLYGIKIYLYINEPRTMPLSFFEKYPDMKGAVKGQYACMCTSSQQTLAYLSSAVERLCSAVPELGGFFTITMSENLTHCKSRPQEEIETDCQRCAEREPWELVAEVNRTIADAAHKVNPSILVIAWDWAWSLSKGFVPENVKRCIEAMPENVAIMSKRETAIPFVRGGVSGKVEDYALSVEGLSSTSVERWRYATQSGHDAVAKVQVNNTWECSTVPYLPVYRMLYNQIASLMEAKVSHLMLSWTLGGYPSPNIRLLSEAFFVENGNEELDFERALGMVYGEKAEQIKAATDIFCEAFREFPFHLDVLYFGPQNGGAANPLYRKPTGYEATMTCYCYDDLETWRANYPPEILEQQFGLVSSKWEEGLKLLPTDLSELSDIAYVGYSLFKASYNQVRFVRLRDSYLCVKTNEIRQQILAILNDERQLAIRVYEIMCLRPEIGFEAANHYYYSLSSVREKIVNCDWLIDYYKNDVI